jgi:hypothetical protein
MLGAAIEKIWILEYGPFVRSVKSIDSILDKESLCCNLSTSFAQKSCFVAAWFGRKLDFNKGFEQKKCKANALKPLNTNAHLWQNLMIKSIG